MPSNVRKYDNSCKNLAPDVRVFYQCITCEPLEVLFICQHCVNESDHQGHKLIQNKDINQTKFCNCGDGTAVYYCRRHKKMEFPFEEKPIYLNKDDLYRFTRTFGLSQPDASRIARLNQIREVGRHSKDGKIIQNYFENSNYHNIRDMTVIKIWSAYRKDRELNFVANGYDQTRRLLLWHGTRKENLVGILDDGFRRPDPKRVTHGSKFGRGIYFADRVSKSAYYCDGNGYGLLFLCEVALGAMWRTGLPKNYKDVPQEFDSIKGLGTDVPDKKGNTLFDDVKVPSGKSIPHPHPKIKYSKLDCNEYIVFDPDRILIRFVLLFKRDPSGCTIQ